MSTSPILESKDPSDRKDYSIDWADLLSAESETAITSSYWGDRSAPDLVSDGAGGVSSAASPFTAADVGRTLQILLAGTGFTPGAYTISSVTSNGVATLNSSPGASKSGGTWQLLHASDPLGMTVETAAPYASTIVGTVCLVWVSGGVAGTRYNLINSIITAGITPRLHQRTITIPCVPR